MGFKNLNYEERKKIEVMYAEGKSKREIADAVEVNISTLYRELLRGETEELNGKGRRGYSAAKAQGKVEINLKRRGRKRSVSA